MGFFPEDFISREPFVQKLFIRGFFLQETLPYFWRYLSYRTFGNPDANINIGSIVANFNGRKSDLRLKRIDWKKFSKFEIVIQNT